MTSTRPKGSDVVVLGGGVVGTACADALAAEGASVTLVERSHLAAGTTSACQGGIGEGLDPSANERAYYRAAVRLYQELAAELDIGYQRSGALVVTHGDDASAMKRRAEDLRATGTPCEWLSQAEVAREEPALSPQISGALRLDESGHVSPMRTAFALASRARRMGASIWTATAVEGIEVSNDRVRAVLTARGRVALDWLVVAAGVWSREVALMARLRLPVWPLKGHVLVTEPRPGLLRHYVSDAAYERTVSVLRDLDVGTGDPAVSPPAPQVATVLQALPTGSLLIGSSREFAGHDRSVDRVRLREIAKAAVGLVPILGRVRLMRTYAGLRPWTPDGRPIIGPTSQLDGLVFATGHGGEGNTGALITGRLVADMYAGRVPSVDATRFAPDRFNLR